MCDVVIDEHSKRTAKHLVGVEVEKRWGKTMYHGVVEKINQVKRKAHGAVDARQTKFVVLWHEDGKRSLETLAWRLEFLPDADSD